MDEKPETGRNYIKNIETSRGRTLRVELIGDISESERHFLDGMGFFMSGTLSKDDDNHTCSVSQLMGKLVKQIMAKMRKDMGGTES